MTDDPLLTTIRLGRAKLSIEGLSIGDAYGNHHGSNQRKNAAQIWQFSDDTLMALSIYENLREFGEINQDALAQSFADRWDAQRGYGQGVTRLLKSISRGGDWRQTTIQMFEGQGSYGNGAAMRVAPVGAYFADTLDKVVQQATLSASVTHAHPEGIAGAIAVAVAAALISQSHRSDAVPDWKMWLDQVIQYVPESEVRRKIVDALKLDISISVSEAANVLGNGRPAIAQRTVPFALWAASHVLGDYKKAIRQTASVGGDIDTNCAIVGSIVVIYTGIQGIPEEWLRRREPLPAWAFGNGETTF